MEEQAWLLEHLMKGPKELQVGSILGDIILILVAAMMPMIHIIVVLYVCSGTVVSRKTPRCFC